MAITLQDIERRFASQLNRWEDTPEDNNRASAVAKDWSVFGDDDRISWFIARVIRYYLVSIEQSSGAPFPCAAYQCALIDTLGGYAYYESCKKEGGRPGEVTSEAFRRFLKEYYPPPFRANGEGWFYSVFRCGILHALASPSIGLGGDELVADIAELRYQLRDASGGLSLDQGVPKERAVWALNIHYFRNSTLDATLRYLENLASGAPEIRRNFLKRHRDTFR